MINYQRLLILILGILFDTGPVASWWLYAWPEGTCASFATCQECVVEYAYGEYGYRKPCTWCPSKGTCEPDGCGSGVTTYRDTCPIRVDMPQCVYFQYSFWFSAHSAPNNRNQCDEAYANDFATQWTDNAVIKICNGEQQYYESACNAWGCTAALILSKNPYGLEVDLNYDVWANAGYGEDRRRIETETVILEDNSFKWLCQAAHQGATVKQSMIMKYRVTEEKDESVTDINSVVNDADNAFVEFEVFASIILGVMMIYEML